MPLATLIAGAPLATLTAGVPLATLIAGAPLATLTAGAPLATLIADAPLATLIAGAPSLIDRGRPFRSCEGPGRGARCDAGGYRQFMPFPHVPAVR